MFDCFFFEIDIRKYFDKYFIVDELDIFVFLKIDVLRYWIVRHAVALTLKKGKMLGFGLFIIQKPCQFKSRFVFRFCQRVSGFTLLNKQQQQQMIIFTNCKYSMQLTIDIQNKKKTI